MKYDYLIVGSGLFGSVFANQAASAGKKCLVIEKRPVIGGNIRTEQVEGIHCHVHGPHIFHTNDEALWRFVNGFVKFKPFIYSPVAMYHGRVFNLPFNMHTFYQVWGVSTPAAAMKKLKQQTSAVKEINNLEDQAIALVGEDIYRVLIKEYTEKQWNRNCEDLPAFIIKRLPVRFTWDNNYFNDIYQGIPEGGYNKLTEGLLQGIECRTGTDYFQDRDYFNSLADQIVYSGSVDEFYDYRFGHLEYRSLAFESEVLELDNFQGTAVVNYTSHEVPYTRIIEHKHFEGVKVPGTVVSLELPQKWEKGRERYYPVNDSSNMALFQLYSALAGMETRVIFGGRLGAYRYYDMHQVIAAAMKQAKESLKTG